jgi:hypothetical protein
MFKPRTEMTFGDFAPEVPKPTLQQSHHTLLTDSYMLSATQSHIAAPLADLPRTVDFKTQALNKCLLRRIDNHTRVA